MRDIMVSEPVSRVASYSDREELTWRMHNTADDEAASGTAGQVQG